MRFLVLLAVLPVVVLLIYIYTKDRIQKEPIKKLIVAFLGGILAIPLTLGLVSIIRSFYHSDTVFYSSFWEAGIPEELAKFLIFMIFIWRSKYFDEYFDGIVYAVFIGLGFACVENIMYVLGNDTFEQAVEVGKMRAILSVPAHFLFGVIMGYYLALAKFGKSKIFNLMLALLIPVFFHGAFDFLLIFCSGIDDTIAYIVFYGVFIILDIFMWIFAMKKVKKLSYMTDIQHNNSIFKDIFKIH